MVDLFIIDKQYSELIKRYSGLQLEFKGEKYKVPNDPKGLLTYMWHDWETPQGGNWGKMGNKRIPKGTFNPEGS